MASETPDRAALEGVKRFALAHHSDQDPNLWLHALLVDIPSAVDAALATPPAPEAAAVERWYAHVFRPIAAFDDRCGWEDFGTRCKLPLIHRHHDFRMPQPAPAPPAPTGSASAEALAKRLMLDLFTKWPEHGRKRMRDLVEAALPAIIAAARAPLTVEALARAIAPAMHAERLGKPYISRTDRQYEALAAAILAALAAQEPGR